MNRPVTESPSYKSLTLLSRMLLQPRPSGPSASLQRTELKRELLNMSHDEFSEMLSLAHSHHVDVRWLEVFLNLIRGENATRTEWAEGALAAERMRIATAILFLRDICAAFQECWYDVTVIKSLDHWPDLGSDLDLYTDAAAEGVAKLLDRSFGAQHRAAQLGRPFSE